MALLQILNTQVEELVKSGSTDPEALYNSLGEYHLISKEELLNVRTSYQSEHVRIMLPSPFDCISI
jgi:hypothetical protein